MCVVFSSCLLLDIGDVYSWGWNESGQVGLPCNKLSNGEVDIDSREGSNFVMYPTLLFSDQEDLRVETISCGSRHSVILCSEFLL